MSICGGVMYIMVGSCVCKVFLWLFLAVLCEVSISAVRMFQTADP
jgi:hypothetical protein